MSPVVRFIKERIRDSFQLTWKRVYGNALLVVVPVATLSTLST